MLKLGENIQGYKGCNVRWHPLDFSDPAYGGCAYIASATPDEDNLSSGTEITVHFHRGDAGDYTHREVRVNWSAIGAQSIATTRAYANMMSVACEVAEVIEALYAEAETNGTGGKA